MTAEISTDREYLSVELASGVARFHAVWLRDNARDAETISPQNGQRLITLLDQPRDIRVDQAKLADGDKLSLKFVGDQRWYYYPLSWLEQHSYDRPAHENPGWIDSALHCWDNSLQQYMPSVDYADAHSDQQVLGQWLGSIKRHGFAIMRKLPQHPEALLQAAALFGYVRETNYGLFFDVRSEIKPVNLAYTRQGLQAHTDNPYRDPVPTLQILACLENTVAGGDSIVVDGFNAIQTLQSENPDHFSVLSRYCARFEYAGEDGVVLRSKRPMIELNPDGELIAIRFNNRSAAPFIDIPFDQMALYYRAYRHLSEILERPQLRLSFRLEPNELFIVDNLRVLHSRTAFSGSGDRWLRGCYVDRDGLLSTLAAIQA